MTNQATDGLEEATERLRRMQARREAERKAARFEAMIGTFFGGRVGDG